ncbi:MAG: ATP-binding protein, partial [Firmicutes bacterium]|nr:ATP-binding protein [Bacillota bacterium]
LARLQNDPKSLQHYGEIRTQLLQQLGISNHQIAPTPHCLLCGDTGYEKGVLCKCVKNHFIETKKQGLGKFTFGNLYDIDLSFYDDPTTASKNINTLKLFCEKFPNVQRNTLVLYGDTGSGKTFLAGCVANALLAKGVSLLMCSSYEFFADMQKYHTTFDATKQSLFAHYLDTDVLIVDDLGAEIMLKNITIEYLYLLLSERQRNNKTTLFTTNLSDNATSFEDAFANRSLTRYGERIASRLSDKNQSLVMCIKNSDKRRSTVPTKSPATKK